MAAAVVGLRVVGSGRGVFRLDPEAATRPTTFVVRLSAEGPRYTYGFSVDADGIDEERLYSYPEKRRRVLFDGVGVTSSSGCCCIPRRARRC
ncbi:hypothetical protein [Amycolatopsis coloradensis]